MPSDNKACFYVMTVDSGFAPNPFHKVCTLALCTPNHMRANLKKGDLIVGCFRKRQAKSELASGRHYPASCPRVVYVMELDQDPLALTQYLNDPRYGRKKPSTSADPISRIGDNIYEYRNGKWRQHPDAKHHRIDNYDDLFIQKKPRPDWVKDVQGDRVFTSNRFVYFGESPEQLPVRFSTCVPRGPGLKYMNDKMEFGAFRSWAFDRLHLGRLNNPNDLDGKSSCIRSKGCRKE